MTLAIHNAIVRARTFDYWWESKIGTTVPFDTWVIELVEKFDAGAIWDTNQEWESGKQGWSGESYMIFSVSSSTGKPDRFFRKNGTCDSYGSNSWDGTFEEAVKVEKIVETWEYM